MVAGTITAGHYNSQRTKQSDKVWTYEDFHPGIVRPKRKKLGGKAFILASMQAAENLVFAEGYSLESISGKLASD